MTNNDNNRLLRHLIIFRMHRRVQLADRNSRLGIGLRFNRAWAWRSSYERGIRIVRHVDWEKHEGQHSIEINRVIRCQACYNRFPHKWTYCGSPMANIFSRSGHNPPSILEGDKGPTAGIPVDRTEAIHCRCMPARRIAYASPRAGGKTRTKLLIVKQTYSRLSP